MQKTYEFTKKQLIQFLVDYSKWENHKTTWAGIVGEEFQTELFTKQADMFITSCEDFLNLTTDFNKIED